MARCEMKVFVILTATAVLVWGMFFSYIMARQDSRILALEQGEGL